MKPNLLFLGTEFGLYVSIDGGKAWAQFKGSRFPAVAVRDLAIQPRDNDLVLATHGRGIWIIDDITPLRALTPELLTQEAGFVSARPVQQRNRRQRRLANGDAVFVGDNPPDAAVITYYQKSRHLFGKLKIEVLDASGKVIDEPAGQQTPGTESRDLEHARKAAARPAGGADCLRRHSRSRVLPGVYTVRMTKNGKPYETKLTVGLDRRAKFSEADRKAQFDAAMKVQVLFGDESALMDRIHGLAQQPRESRQALPEAIRCKQER